ncbi:MAG: SDR family oxidoreductase [archaeon]|nr:SDR family oxidoreductase [archaeon]
MVDLKEQGNSPDFYKQMFSLENQVAIVTGGAGHLGSAISKSLAAFGAKVIVLGRNKQTLDSFLEKYDSQFKGRFDAEVCDVTDKSQFEKIVDSTLKKYDKIDVLVNAAYQKSNKKFEDMSVEDWTSAINGALTHYAFCTQEVSKSMLKKGKGSVINIASLYASLGTDSRIFLDLGNCPGVDYSVAKHGVLGMTKYLATRWATRGIRVNAISPGYFPKMNPNVPERKDYIIEICNRTPMRKIGQPDDLAGAIVYLASNASSFVTGQNLIVDGGWSSW